MKKILIYSFVLLGIFLTQVPAPAAQAATCFEDNQDANCECTAPAVATKFNTNVRVGSGFEYRCFNPEEELRSGSNQRGGGTDDSYRIGGSDLYDGGDSNNSAKPAGDSKVGISYSLTSPLSISSDKPIQGILLALLRVFITIAIPIIVMAIIYAGFLYVTARGNAEQTKKATTALSYAIIGAIILIGAVVIGEIIGNLVGAFRS